jgi:hypothetical protein
MSEEQTQEQAETSKEIKEKQTCGKEGCQEDHFSIDHFFGLTEDDKVEDAAKKVEEKLGVSIEVMKQQLSQYVIDHAEELTLELPNIAPMGDYGKLLENNDDMTQFLKEEANKIEHWKFYSIEQSQINKSLLSFKFANFSVDDGNTLTGFVFVSKTGKIRHSFAKIEE